MEFTQRPLEKELDSASQEKDFKAVEDEVSFKQFLEKRANYLYKKAQYEQQRLKDFNEEQRRLKERLTQLDQETQGNSQDIDHLKKRIAEYRFREKEVLQRQDQAEQDLLRAIRYQHMEQVIQKKLELQNLQNQSKVLSEKELQLNNYIDAVADERNRRDSTNVQHLQKILHKAETIDKALKQGDLDKQNLQLLAQTYLGNNKLERNRALDEVVANRQKEKQRYVLELQNKIHQLNEERWQLLQKHEEVLKKKDIHQRMMDRGVDFLAELELGQGPPKEYLEKNLASSQLDISNLEKPVNEVVDYVKEGLEAINQRIQALREQKDRTQLYLSRLEKPYQGEADIRKLRPDLSPELYIAFKDLVHEIVDNFWKVIQQSELDREKVVNEKKYFEHKNEVFKERYLHLSKPKVYGEVAEELLVTAIEEMLEEITGDMLNVAKFAENTVFDLVAVGVYRQRDSTLTELEISELLKKMMKEQLQ